MSKVYITQEVSTVDYGPATKYGDLVFVTNYNDRLSPHPSSTSNKDIVELIQQRLKNFTADDYLICTGAPAIMALCGTVLGNRLRKLLIWDNRSFGYFAVGLPSFYTSDDNDESMGFLFRGDKQ